MSGTRMGRDVFLALAAVGWADGKLDSDEADAIVRTAAEEGLAIEEIAEIEAATQKPIDMGTIDRTGLSKEDRLFVYAVASWMTRLDGKMTTGELDALQKLGGALGISESARSQADSIAQDVAFMPAGDRPDRYDLAKLRRILAARLAAAKALRESQQKKS